MPVSSKHTKEFIYRCERQLELLSRREDFTSWIKDIRLRFDTHRTQYDLEQWFNHLKQLDSRYKLENGEPDNRKDWLKLPSEQFRLAMKVLMFESKLDNFWYQPLVSYVLVGSVTEAIKNLPPFNGISIDYEWDHRYGGETIKLSIGLSTNKKQLDGIVGLVEELQKKIGGEKTKVLKASRPRKNFSRDLHLYDLAMSRPSKTSEERTKILDEINQETEDENSVIGYEKFDTIVNKISKEIETVI